MRWPGRRAIRGCAGRSSAFRRSGVRARGGGRSGLPLACLYGIGSRVSRTTPVNGQCRQRRQRSTPPHSRRRYPYAQTTPPSVHRPRVPGADCPGRSVPGASAGSDGAAGDAGTSAYGPRWPGIRRRYLYANPWCVLCSAPATVADHFPESRRSLGGRRTAPPPSPASTAPSSPAKSANSPRAHAPRSPCRNLMTTTRISGTEGITRNWMYGIAGIVSE